MNENIKILVVDDEPQTLHLYSHLLEKAGYEVIQAHSGKEALRYVGEACPDLVLLDVVLPDIDGVEVCRRIKSNPACANCFVALISGLRVISGNQAEGLEAGADDYITRPISNRELLARVKALLRIKRVEQTLQESEQLFRDTFEAIPDPTILWRHQDGRFTFHMANQAVHKMSRGRIAEFMDVTAEEFFADAPDVLSNIRRAFETGEHIRLELPYQLRTTGEDKWVVADYVKVSDRYVLNTIRDITERVKAEQDVRGNEMLLSRAEVLTHLGSWEWNIRSDRITTSKGWRRIHGCEDRELSLEDLLPITHPEDRQKVERAIEHSLEHNEPYDIEHRIIRQDDGEVRFVKEYGELVSDRDGPIKMYCASQDITEHKQAEKALRKSEELLYRVFDTSPSCIFVKNSAGEYLMANKAIADLYKTTPQEMIGKADLDFVALSRLSNEEAEQFLQDDLRAIETQQLQLIPEEPFTLPDGSVRWFQTTKVPIALPDDPNCMLGVAVDITKRKQMEERLLQQERLAAVGQLAGGIAHDFNNLLGAIILYAQMPLGKHTDLPPDVVRAFETILSESRRAADLIEQILDFSRKSMMRIETLDLVSHVDKITKVLRRTLPENIRILFDARTEKCILEADPTRIQQVLLNLATNARDAMPGGGELRVAVDAIDLEQGEKLMPHIGPFGSVTEPSPGRWALLTVSDTGVGLSEEAQEHLFEPFFTTKEPGKGTGLGLAQVYGIVKQHGGYICVNSKLGKGTTFSIHLPNYNTAQSTANEPNTPDLLSGQEEVILVVEDAPRLRKAMCSFLKMLNYRVLSAADGAEALATYRTEHIDLVITDLVMPTMSGQELLKTLQEENAEIKMIAITGHVMDMDPEELMQIGFTKVISKPFDVDLLANVVRQTLEAA